MSFGSLLGVFAGVVGFRAPWIVRMWSCRGLDCILPKSFSKIYSPQKRSRGHLPPENHSEQGKYIRRYIYHVKARISKGIRYMTSFADLATSKASRILEKSTSIVADRHVSIFLKCGHLLLRECPYGITSLRSGPADLHLFHDSHTVS